MCYLWAVKCLCIVLPAPPQGRNVTLIYDLTTMQPSCSNCIRFFLISLLSDQIILIHELRIKRIIYPHVTKFRSWPGKSWITHSDNNKVHGANVGPTWDREDPGGPHVGHMNFPIWAVFLNWSLSHRSWYGWKKVRPGFDTLWFGLAFGKAICFLK